MDFVKQIILTPLKNVGFKLLILLMLGNIGRESEAFLVDLLIVKI